jgi:transcriptional regulator with XRE-family HTH domain
MGMEQRRRGGPQPHPSDHPLRSWRTGQRLSIEALAAAVGVSPGTISRIERDRQTLSLGLVERLQHATGGMISADAFLWRGRG